MKRLIFVLLMLTCEVVAGEDRGANGPPSRPADDRSGLTSPPDGNSEEVLFEKMPIVETAALYTQTLQEAPAHVTVISADEIRKFGYRTLSEVLANVAGFYMSSEGVLQYGGVRGFSLPGDYNTRFLVLVNGHSLTDNVSGAMYMFGQDFGVDMDLVQRIEVVRGPSSALYGSNGMLATVNILTKAPADIAGSMVSMEIGSFGEKKLLVSSSHYLGRGANLLISTSAFNTSGRTVLLPDLIDTTLTGGRTDRVGAERGYHSFAHLTWRNWSVAANFGDHHAEAPAGWFSSTFGDPGTGLRDAHNFIEGSWTRPVGRSSSLRFRLSYDQFRYRGRLDSENSGIVYDFRNNARGDWIGTQFAFQTRLARFGMLTVGSQGSADIRSTQQSYYHDAPQDLLRNVSEPNHFYGVFVQQQWDFTRNWTAYLGLRLDDTKLQEHSVSPRLGVVYQSSPSTFYKVLYGKAFRNPSAYEQFWSPNPALRAEKMRTIEFVRDQRLGQRVNLTLAAFHYRLAGLIEGVTISDSQSQYQNVSSARATGVEVELRARPLDWMETSGSLSLLDAHWRQQRHAHLPNSPRMVSQFRTAMPLFRNKLTVGLTGRYISEREDTLGNHGRPVFNADATATTNRLHRDFDLQFGIRNLANRLVEDPVSEQHLSTWMPRAGRSVFLKLLWRLGD
jgi:outer membrane receptor protein involved in Fe transport